LPEEKGGERKHEISFFRREVTAEKDSRKRGDLRVNDWTMVQWKEGKKRQPEEKGSQERLDAKIRCVADLTKHGKD